MDLCEVDARMAFPLPLTLPPMEADSVDQFPVGDGWQYEPKWDGFRCIAFRDGDQIELRSKAGQPLGRYFPEVVEALRGLKPLRYVLDGELLVVKQGIADFDALLQRLHPAQSRVRKLSQETPAWLLVFDLLADADGKSLIDEPLERRRTSLEAFAKKFLVRNATVRLSPVTTKIATARKWLGGAGSSRDGLIAKRRAASYAAGERHAMVKSKPHASADCVVGGFRYASKGRLVGSLLLGLFDDEGLLHHVGFCSGLSGAEKPALTKKLEALRGGTGFTGKAPGGPSRWSNERSTKWEPLEPTLVVEVSFDHVTNLRFRHGTRLLRWRPDKSPRQCTFAQLKQRRMRVIALLS
jgi:ATP-dependent DNA ligase